MATKVKVLPNSPKQGLAGCHWNGTEASIRNGGRRTVSLVMTRAALHLCVPRCKGHGAAPRAGDEGSDPRGDPRGAHTIRATEALAYSRTTAAVVAVGGIGDMLRRSQTRAARGCQGSDGSDAIALALGGCGRRGRRRRPDAARSCTCYGRRYFFISVAITDIL